MAIEFHGSESVWLVNPKVNEMTELHASARCVECNALHAAAKAEELSGFPCAACGGELRPVDDGSGAPHASAT